jgi:hypothetical protein
MNKKKPTKKTAPAPAAKLPAKKTKTAPVNAKTAKTDKKSLALAAKTVTVAPTGDEDEDEDAAPAPRSSSKSAMTAAMETATTSTSSGATPTLKNFRHHPDIENFYRFIVENDLRLEAVAIFSQKKSQREVQKATKAARARPN